MDYIRFTVDDVLDPYWPRVIEDVLLDNGLDQDEIKIVAVIPCIKTLGEYDLVYIPYR